AYVINAIFSSVAFLEATINAFYEDIAQGHKNVDFSPEIEHSLVKYWEKKSRKPTLDKYQAALKLTQKRKFINNENPYNNADLLVALRNTLIHYKPNTLDQEPVNDLIVRLKASNVSSNPLTTGPKADSFPFNILGADCARWAVETCGDFTNEFYRRIKS
ncbi:MAG: hypothetical protein K8F25_07305, partial [Fimbriimonadaceae bacterium]|nr:hypothetical protein [Alphaproteobacteria bacterium]